MNYWGTSINRGVWARRTNWIKPRGGLRSPFQLPRGKPTKGLRLSTRGLTPSKDGVPVPLQEREKNPPTRWGRDYPRKRRGKERDPRGSWSGRMWPKMAGVVHSQKIIAGQPSPRAKLKIPMLGPDVLPYKGWTKLNEGGKTLPHAATGEDRSRKNFSGLERYRSLGRS